jgi:hypothetical protein
MDSLPNHFKNRFYSSRKVYKAIDAIKPRNLTREHGKYIQGAIKQFVREIFGHPSSFVCKDIDLSYSKIALHV